MDGSVIHESARRHEEVPIGLIVIDVGPEHGMEGRKHSLACAVTLMVVRSTEIVSYPKQLAKFRQKFPFEIRGIVGNEFRHNTMLEDAFCHERMSNRYS